MAAQEKRAVKEQDSTLLQEMFRLLKKVLILGIILILLCTVLFGAVRNVDLGMSPAVKHGDLVFYYRRNKHYKASDVIAVRVQGQVQLCRVIAVAGDTVDITAAGLLINGSLQQEAEVLGETLIYSEGISFPVTVGEGRVFLLGDNREAAIDSRLYGTVDCKKTLGKVALILRRRNI